MNADMFFMEKFGYLSQLAFDRFLVEYSFGSMEFFAANYTIQFEDYDKYHTAAVNVEKRLRTG